MAAPDRQSVRRKRLTWEEIVSMHPVALALRAVVIIILLIVWEYGAGDPAQGAIIDHLFLSKPSLIFAKLIQWIANGFILSNAVVTMGEAIVGFLVGSTIALMIGFALSVNATVSRIFAPMVFGLYAVPRYAIAPMFILWFGLGFSSKVALVALVVFFYTFINVFEGVRAVDKDLIAVCRLMKASRWQLLRTVTIPSAMTWVALGLRISVPHAFTAAIFAELLAGYNGLGVVMRDSSNQLNSDGLFAATLVTTVLSIVLNWLVQWAVGRTMRWHTVETSGADLGRDAGI
jgi:NitT/TauT family transport system permease protein